MSALVFEVVDGGVCVGMKGPRAAEWLTTHGVVLPMAPNSWTLSAAPGDPASLLVARLGTGEFFLEDAAAGILPQGILPALAQNPPGVYPLLREDATFQLSGEGMHEVLAQVCNVNFAGLSLQSRPAIMTLMIGVAVLVVPQESDAERRYRIWCDPTFGPSLRENLQPVVVECGGCIREAAHSPCP